MRQFVTISGLHSQPAGLFASLTDQPIACTVFIFYTLQVTGLTGHLDGGPQNERISLASGQTRSSSELLRFVTTYCHTTFRNDIEAALRRSQPLALLSPLASTCLPEAIFELNRKLRIEQTILGRSLDAFLAPKQLFIARSREEI
jgi:hypothetical protein